MSENNDRKGRGVQQNPGNRFSMHRRSKEQPEGIDDWEEENPKTKYVFVEPKSIVNKVTSPDVAMDYSINPYQGCEHGCTYCYARPTHEYWGYSSGLEFEQTILVKKNAAELLRATLDKKSWKVKPIVLSGNTDCYQPCERKFELTRSLLEVMLEYRNPIGIITKNVLMKRDLDLLKELSALGLVAVNLSMTTLDESLRRVMEPRTASSARKMKLVEDLVQMGVPVNVMMAPIIPGLTDHEIFAMAKTAASHGARSFGGHMLRLMGPNEALFNDWLTKNFPDRANKVINQLKSIHGGRSGSSVFGDRMRGRGVISETIQRQMEIAKLRYFPTSKSTRLRTDLFRRPSNGQLELFN